MIHEFAVDPVALNNWQDFRYLVENFGVDRGRLISRFPQKWRKMVHEACQYNYDCGKISTMQLHSITERLNDINNKVIKLNRTYNSEKKWLQNAEEQHSIKEFRAIVSIRNPNGQSYILSASEIDETNPLWDVPRERVIQRKSEKIAACAKTLLIASKKILVIDPHFDPTLNRFTRTFSYLVDYAFKNSTPQRLELHVEHKDRSPSFEMWRDRCQEGLSQIVPKGHVLKIVRWNERATGDKMHPRYVLTEIGGIRYDYGLDEWDGVGEGKTVDVILIGPNVYEQRWNDYQRETTTFDFVDEVSIDGNN